jgi:DNA-binding NarL/FixJ family response regulator
MASIDTQYDLMQTSLYLIEDDQTIHDFVQQSLTARPSWSLVGSSTTFAHASEHAAKAVANVYLVDLGLPDGRGEDLLKILAESNPSAELLVFSVFGDESRLIEAIEAGATGYVLKGCSGDELIEAIEQIQAGGAPISALLARLLLKRFQTKPNVSAPSQENPLDAITPFSGRESDVLKLVAQGYVNKEIARKLGISGHTVGGHIKSLYKKLSVHTRVQAVRIAQARGLV